MQYRAIRTPSGQILVPARLRRVPSGVWLYGSCRPVALLVDQAIGWSTRLSTGLLGRERPDAPPVPAETWSDWVAAASDLLATAVTGWVHHLPRDPRRQRFNTLLLGSRGEQVAFAKFTRNPPNPLEIAALLAVGGGAPGSFRAPQLLDHGPVGEWHHVLLTAVPAVPHRPARLAPDRRRRIIGDMQRLVGAAGPDTAVHGDFGPWNVRRLRGGDVFVLDWEEFTTGPALADELWHAVWWSVIRGSGTDRVVRRVRRELSVHPVEQVAEAARFWLARHEQPEPEEVRGDVEQPARLRRNASRAREALRGLA